MRRAAKSSRQMSAKRSTNEVKPHRAAPLIVCGAELDHCVAIFIADIY